MNSKEFAWRIRRNAIDMVSIAHASHIGGILSCADIVAVLYSSVAKVNPHNPKDPHRDRVILSKGHNGVAIYIALAELGFFPKTTLKTYGSNGGIFSCHVSHKKVPGVELSTGSLGQGLGVGVGMALSAKVEGSKHHVFCILGDGECDEGAVWEAAAFASHHCLNNLTIIIDANGMQAMGSCDEVLKMSPLSEKWHAFGCDTYDVDGHDHNDLLKAFLIESKKPKVIVAHTIKGKGVSFMENDLLWHYRDPQGEDLKKAIKELEGKRNAK